MVSVYALFSLHSRIYYVGISKNPADRLLQHNAGKSKFTKGHIPWELIYSETHADYPSARKKEKYYKSAGGKKKLKSILLKTGSSAGFLCSLL
ncbi:MAG: putative endonuclease [Sphingobacteriales bacterium]|jgi:putative endonuclease